MYSIKLYSIKLTVLLHVLLYIWKNQPWYKQGDTSIKNI